MNAPASSSAEDAPRVTRSSYGSEGSRSSFTKQLNALLRKQLNLRKRAKKTNCFLICFPIFLLFVLFLVALLSRSLTEESVSEQRNPAPHRGVVNRILGDFLSVRIPFVVSAPSQRTDVGRLLSGPLFNSSGIFLDFDYNVPMPPWSSTVEYNSKSVVDETMFNVADDTRISIPTGFIFNDYRLGGQPVLNYVVYHNATFSETEEDEFILTRVGYDLPGPLLAIHRAFLQDIANSRGLSVRYQVQYADLPRPEGTRFVDFVPFVEPLYLTWILHFLLPSFVEAVVYEKEKRIVHANRMMGMRTGPFWASQLIFNVALYVLSTVLLIAFGFVFRLHFFSRNSPSIYIVLFLVWGFTLLMMSLFFSSVFHNAQAAVLGLYLLIILLGVAAFVISYEVIANDSGDAVLHGLMVIPTFALCIALRYLSYAAGEENNGLDLASANEDYNRVGDAMVALLIAGVVFGLAFLLTEFWPQVRRMCQRVLHALPMWNGHDSQGTQEVPQKPPSSSFEIGATAGASNIGVATEHDVIDEFIYSFDAWQQEQAVANEGARPPLNLRGVIVQDAKKTFIDNNGRSIHALKGVSLHIARGECVGLLGHNGAGKTTLINLLTGLFPANGGRMIVDGFDANVDLANIHAVLGVCSQTDLLWEDMTGRETLMFYSRLKNVPPDEISAAVEQLLRSINLVDFADQLVRKYSGGMKRRLSVAIALCGSPAVSLFDEPTTGLDPHARRELWSVIQAFKKDRCVLLTTHSMEEADALCDRVAIMQEGRLRCIGYPQALKQVFGSGYHVTLSVPLPRQPTIYAWAADVFPGTTVYESYLRRIILHMPKHVAPLSFMIRQLNIAAQEFNIEDWGYVDRCLSTVVFLVS
jgi:ABC-type multidrug transport system ATPase subunit